MKKDFIETAGSRKARVNLARVDATTEEEIEAQAIEDGEEVLEWTPEMTRRVKIFQPQKKQAITVRLEPQIIAALKAEGPGYQTRMNAILKDWLLNRQP